MATKIRINRQDHLIRQPVIDAIRYMDRELARSGHDYALREEFKRGGGRYATNPVAALGLGLEVASAGALRIAHTHHEAAHAAHPRAHAFVIIANKRRHRLVLRKLAAIGRENHEYGI